MARVPGSKNVAIANLFRGTCAEYTPIELYLLSVLDEIDEHHPIIDRLSRRGVVVNFDELAAVETLGRAACAAPGIVSLTICPTMGCNFDCPQDEPGGAGRRRGARRAHARGLRRSPARRHLVRRRAAAVPRRHRVALRAPDGPRGGEGLHLQGWHHHQRLPARPGRRRHAREGQGRHRAGDHRRARAHPRRDAAPRGRRRELRAHHLQPPRPQDPVQGHHQAQRPRGQPCRDGRARGPGQAHGRGVGQPARLLPRAGERLRGGGRPRRAGRAPVRLVRKRGRRPSGGEALCAWQGILLRRLHALERRR